MRVKHHNYLVSAFPVPAQMLRLAQLPSRGPAQQQPPPRRRPNRNQKRKLKADQEAFERVLRAKGLTLDNVSATAASRPHRASRRGWLYFGLPTKPPGYKPSLPQAQLDRTARTREWSAEHVR